MKRPSPFRIVSLRIHRNCIARVRGCVPWRNWVGSGDWQFHHDDGSSSTLRSCVCQGELSLLRWLLLGNTRHSRISSLLPSVSSWVVFVAILVICEGMEVVLRFLWIARSELSLIEVSSFSQKWVVSPRIDSIRIFHYGDGTTCIEMTRRCCETKRWDSSPQGGRIANQHCGNQNSEMN